MQIDPLNEAGVHDRRAEHDVIEVGDADAVQEVADVARRCASHVEKGQPRGHGDHARHGLDGPEGITEGSGDQPHFLATEGLHRRRGLLAVYHDLDLLGGRAGGRRYGQQAEDDLGVVTGNERHVRGLCGVPVCFDPDTHAAVGQVRGSEAPSARARQRPRTTLRGLEGDARAAQRRSRCRVHGLDPERRGGRLEDVSKANARRHRRAVAGRR
jgi:hypothetical protein